MCVWGGGGGGGEYLEIVRHEVLCDFLEGVVHYTLPINEHQASSGVWLKRLALKLLI